MSDVETQEQAPEWLQAMTVLDVEEGDLVVFQSHEWLHDEARRRIHEMWEHVVAERGWADVQAMVVEKMDVGVLRNADVRDTVTLKTPPAFHSEVDEVSDEIWRGLPTERDAVNRATEPVAWRWRHRREDGEWSEWAYSHGAEKPETFKELHRFTQIQPLYTESV